MAQYGLCFGVNDYSAQRASGLWSSCSDLPYSINDAQDFQQLLVNAFAFDPSNVQLYTDTSCTRDNMLSAMNAVLRNTQAGDVVCVFYSGHGARLPGPTPDSPLTSQTYYEALVPYSGVLTDSDLAQVIGQLEYGYVNFTIVLGSCHSGGMDPSQQGAQPLSMSLAQDISAALAQYCQTLVPFGLCLLDPASALGTNVTTSNGMVCMTADTSNGIHYVSMSKDTLLACCAANEEGWQVPALQNSLLVAAMKNIVNASNYQVSYADFLNLIQPEVDRLMSQYIRVDPQHSQDTSVPQLFGQQERVTENVLGPWTYTPVS